MLRTWGAWWPCACRGAPPQSQRQEARTPALASQEEREGGGECCILGVPGGRVPAMHESALGSQGQEAQCLLWVLRGQGSWCILGVPGGPVHVE